MSVRLTTSVAGRGWHARAGDVVDLDPDTEKAFLEAGYAEEVDKSGKPKARDLTEASKAQRAAVFPEGTAEEIADANTADELGEIAEAVEVSKSGTKLEVAERIVAKRDGTEEESSSEGDGSGE